MKLQVNIPYFNKEHRIILAGGAGFFVHLIDEIIHQADIPPTPVLFLIIATLWCYPIFSLRVRGFLVCIMNILIIIQLTNNHLIPYLQTGETEGIETATIGIFVALSVSFYTLRLIHRSFSKIRK